MWDRLGDFFLDFLEVDIVISYKVDSLEIPLLLKNGSGCSLLKINRNLNLFIVFLLCVETPPGPLFAIPFFHFFFLLCYGMVGLSVSRIIAACTPTLRKHTASET